MYEAYYRLQTKPFTLLPDPEFLFLGTRHKMALSLLEYGLVNGSAFIIITGEPGTGKTTLLNRVLDQSNHRWTTGLLSNTRAGLGGLMPWIAAAFGLETNQKDEVQLFHAFRQFLEHEQTANRRVLLVLDEAQNVGAAMLEELRLLSNLNDGRRRSLQILLSGQPALRQLLEEPGMEQFSQRISMDYALEPLAEDEVTAYVHHRVRVAGGRRPLFSRLACRKVYALTGGIPRLINQLCDHALVYGYAAQAETITAGVVLDAARGRDAHGLLPLRAAPDRLTPSRDELEAEAEEIAAHAPVSEPDVPRAAVNPQSADPTAAYREALALKRAGDFVKAIGLFDRIAGEREIGAKALAQKGLCLKAIGRYDDALAAFRNAMALPAPAQDVVSLQYLCARTLEAMGRSEEAVEMYRRLKSRRRDYRDVAARMDRLTRVRANGAVGTVGATTWLGSIFRGCGQWLRGAQSPPFISTK